MRTRGLALIAVVSSIVLAGCTLPPPSGDAPLRYRDFVFSTADVTRDISYGEAPDLQGNPVDLELDLYQPAGDTVARRPAMVWIHGGGFTAGDKASGAAKATYFARLGYVVVSINYRLLSPDGCGGDREPPPICEQAVEAAQHDAQAAVRWLRANASTYRIDPDRIAAAGSSAGAVTSLVVSWRPDDPGNSGNPGPSSRRARGRVDRGRHPRPTSSSTRATRPPSSSTAPRTRPCSTTGPCRTPRRCTTRACR